ncbi:MAG TPA: site-specific DNA-methyltransferase [Lachnospiraceae bacterium]|nr:site-specific DNA-methyltransferase [Lachnospiraceae bacterium]
MRSLEINKTYTGDCLNVLKTFPERSVNCCITSPPYFRLRDYGIDGQIGMEETPEQYIDRLTEVFREVRRVLKDDGTLWVNIGDSYVGTGGDRKNPVKNIIFNQQQQSNPKDGRYESICKMKDSGLKQKDLIGIPWLLAFSLRADGWYLRQDIIWHKPNPMPESVTDRCTKSHEYIFLLSKSPKYYYDAEAIAEDVTESTTKRLYQNVQEQRGSVLPGKTNGNMKAKAPRFGEKKYTEDPETFFRTKSGNAYEYRPKRNKRDVWTVTTKPYKGAHFATFPQDLIEPCILAGCPKDGIVIDPFFGSGTTGAAAQKYNRNYIGIEINPKYCNLAETRNASVQISMEVI